jgi:hypothetical protein
MINIGFRSLLPQDWRYGAWVDADVSFSNADWALETIHALQHHPIIQPWSEALDQGPNGNIIQMFRSFASQAYQGLPQSPSTGAYTPGPGHPGFAWACTREFYEQVHGLMQFPILGSADNHMAWSLINRVEESIHADMHDNFKLACQQWQTNAYQITNGHIGYIPGAVHHSWHGKKASRRYKDRWNILVDHGFDPFTDLRRDAQGIQYIHGKPHLEEDIHQYFRQRNEDGVDE